MKKAALAIAIIALIAAAFWGGTYYAGKTGSSAPGMAAGGPGGTGGPMANLTEEQQAEVANMTDEERQAYFQEQMGSRDASGTIGAGGGPGGPGGGTVEGEVVEVASDSITIKTSTGSSSTYYMDSDTVTAYVTGVDTLATGSTVMISATPAADNVTNATLIVVTK